MLELALEAILSLNDSSPTAEKIFGSFTAARSRIMIFGTDDEEREFERLLKLIEANFGGILQRQNIDPFSNLVVSGFRKEIGLPARHSNLVPKE